MYVSYDPEAGATYVERHDGVVARTVSLSDLVMVDLDANGYALGVEFVVSPTDISDAMLESLVKSFPEFKALAERDSWILAPA